VLTHWRAPDYLRRGRQKARPRLTCHDLNSYCERLVSLRVNIGQQSYCAFRLCLMTGLITAVLLNLALSNHLGLSKCITVASIALALLTAYVVACARKILTGVEKFTFFQHLISVTLSTWAFMWLLSQPILVYLDVNIVTVGAVAVPGRIGCLKAGCCHGRPCRFGIRYGAEHAAAGFNPQLVGLRLFPIQMIECLCAAAIVAVGSFMIWQGYPPGAAAGWFFVSYCATRFCFEFARWPANYQFRSGLSPYQWISVVLLVLPSGLEFAGVFPFQLWHFAIAVVLLIATFVIVLERQLRSLGKDLSRPDHIRELSGLIDPAGCRDGNAATVIPLITTSLGLQISTSRIRSTSGDVCHYAFSCRQGKLTDAAAGSLAKLILGLKHASGRTEMFEGNRGVFHLLIHPQTSME
jgi:thiosulfate reductase cytochrome b subunit